ncbi:MAG: glycosyltransferase family 9 protein [Nitrospinae bacterium]|nr:glycosyltransferase family 9 protein [Nitrospinota bacterium]
MTASISPDKRGRLVDGAQRILVIRAGALGDCVLMLPTLSALRARFPRARIDVMGYPMRWAWVLGRGLVDQVHSIDRPGMHLMFCEAAELPDSLKTFLGAYDVILSYRPDPEGVFTTNLRKLGGSIVLSQSPFPPPPPPKAHVADFALKLVAELGVPPPRAMPRLQLNAGEHALVQPFFAVHGIDPSHDRLAVLHPGSGSETKRWPVERYAALARELAYREHVLIVIIVGYAERALVPRLLPLLHGVKPLVAENWPLLHTAALIAHAAVFIGNDSGLTHLAAVLGNPTVAIFGPTDPEIWGPRGKAVTIVQMTGGDAEREWTSQDQTCTLSERPDVVQVLNAAQRWLEVKHLTQSPDGRSARS